jgi:hypothetical protein
MSKRDMRHNYPGNYPHQYNAQRIQKDDYVKLLNTPGSANLFTISLSLTFRAPDSILLFATFSQLAPLLTWVNYNALVLWIYDLNSALKYFHPAIKRLFLVFFCRRFR